MVRKLLKRMSCHVMIHGTNLVSVLCPSCGNRKGKINGKGLKPRGRMSRPACEIVSDILFSSEKGPSERMCPTETTQTPTWHAGQDTNSNMLRQTHSESQLQTGERLQR